MYWPLSIPGIDAAGAPLSPIPGREQGEPPRHALPATEPPRAMRYAGQSQPNVPAVRSAYTSPSKVDLRVELQARLYQMEFCHSATL